jgi:hypothetical protein
MATPQTVEELDPAVALRPGRFDPAAVLVLWCVRKAFYPLLWLGLIFATAGGRADEIDEAGGVAEYIGTLDSASEIVAAALSPLVIVLLAFGLRIAVAGLAFALAYPLTTWNQPSDYAHGRRTRSRSRLWSDRWHLTRAYRALRWTWAVRQVAAERLGEPGRRLLRCGPVLRWASILLLTAYLVTILLTLEP